MSAGSRRPSSRVRATVETATQGRRSSGVASSGGLVDDADRAAAAGDDHDATGLGLLGAPDGLGRAAGRRGRARVGGPGRGPRSSGSRRRSRARRHRAAWHRSTGTARSRTPSSVVEDRGRRRRRSPPAAAASPAPRRRRPGRPSRRRWCRGAALPVTPQTTALSTRPPSSGRPGTRLRTPTSRLAPAEALRPRARAARPGVDLQEDEGDAADRERGERARPPRSRTPRAGVRGLALDRGHAAEEVQGDRGDREPERDGPSARARPRAAAPRRRAAPRTPRPRRTSSRRCPGSASSTAGAITTAIRTATRNHESRDE